MLSRDAKVPSGWQGLHKVKTILGMAVVALNLTVLVGTRSAVDLLFLHVDFLHTGICRSLSVRLSGSFV